MEFFTTTLTSGSLSFATSNGATFVSIQCDSSTGSCTVLGGIPFKGIQPSVVTLTAGQVASFSASSPQSPLNNLIITWVAGNVDIIVGF
jgi:hypothetical protein